MRWLRPSAPLRLCVSYSQYSLTQRRRVFNIVRFEKMSWSILHQNFGAAAGEGKGEFVLGTPIGTVAFAVVMGLAALTVLFFYGRDLKTKSARWKVVLWGLRVLGLACLAIVLLEPTMAWRKRFREEASVVVLLDASASMQLKDKLKNPETRFAIARRHDLLTDDQLQQAESAEPKEEILTAQQNKEVDGLTRMTIVKDFLRWEEGSFLKKLGENLRVKTLEFAGEVKELSGGRGSGAGRVPSKPQTPNPKSQGDEESTVTDISMALREVEKLSAGERVVAAVLVTDGDWNSGSDPVVAAGRLAVEGIPVFCVGVGNPDEVRDIEVADLKVKKSVYLKDSVAVAAEVKWSGYEEKSVAVVLRWGEEVL